MQRAQLTPVAIESLKHVAREHAADRWARARRSGERPSLSALETRGLVVRRAWRGQAGDADAAYEYRLSRKGLDTLKAIIAEKKGDA